jgi:KUP system potassium uptake protein
MVLVSIFLVIDAAFFSANLLKLPDGGWIPLVFGVLIYVVMTTWRRGIDAVRARLAEGQQSTATVLAALKTGAVARVPGTAVFLSRSGTSIPPLLVRHVADMKALQQTVVSLSIDFTETPRVTDADRISVDHVADGLWRVSVRFGFIEVPSLASALALAKDHGCPLNLDDAICFAARDEVVRSKTQRLLPGWRRSLFGLMYRNAVRTPDRFDMPADSFLEIGRQVQL